MLWTDERGKKLERAASENVKFSGFLQPDATPEFAIAFDTRSETEQEVSMS